MATELLRIEDFIHLAKKGKNVKTSIELQKKIVSQKVHPSDTSDMKCEVDMYLLLGNYTFKVEDETRYVSKIYMHGCFDESTVDAKINKHVANERLKVDYKRLSEANIKIEEKYF